ncbi:MAG: tetratricopeptide repeat protein [Pirellulaceae bacterium]|nr:tetratricopeptide repeat protein [Pirellulaceae bacterium]
MSQKPNKGPLREPVLHKLYQHYLVSEESADFIKKVAGYYTVGALERLAQADHRVSRRAALLAIGFLGDYQSNQVVGRALHDDDRVVRLIAENSLRHLWERDGNSLQQKKLHKIISLNEDLKFKEVLPLANSLLERAPWFAEAWNQRAIAYYHLNEFQKAVHDCHQALEINPYHFPAAVGMANCYLELEDGFAALESLRRAKRLNPDMDGVNAQIDYLERTLEGK